MNKLVRLATAATLLVVTVFGFVAVRPAAAAAIQTGSTLDITVGNGTFDVTIETGPVAGHVRLYNVPGVPDGTLFTGVNLIRYTSGTGPDRIQLRQKGAVLPSVRINGGSGALDVDADIDVDFTLTPVTSSLHIDGTGGNGLIKLLLESDANDLTLDWRTTLGAGAHEVNQVILSDDPTYRMAGTVLVDLGAGYSKNNTVVKSMAQVNTLTLTLDAGTTGELSLETDHIRPSPATANVSLSGASKVTWKWGGQTTTLNVTGNVIGSAQPEEFNIELMAGQVSGTLSVPANDGADKVNVIVKGNSNLGGNVNGGAANDELKVLFDGVYSGTLVLDGGPGQDLCTASPGVTVINCE